MTARILCPDDHPDRYGPNKSEAFASVARALRDEVLPDPTITTVIVMVGAPGSGKSTEAAKLAVQHPDAVIVDACHSKPTPREGIVDRIRAAGKRAIAVRMTTALVICQARQAGRTQERKVAPLAVARAHNAIDLDPPMLAEGWTEVLEVDGFVFAHL